MNAKTYKNQKQRTDMVSFPSSSRFRFSLFSILVLFTLGCNSLLAQAPNELDKLYTPDKNSVFNTDANSSSSANSEYVEVNNTIKFNPALLIRSIAAGFYERRLGDNISATGGLGFTYGKDQVLSTGLKAEFGWFGTNYSSEYLDLPTVLQAGKYSSIGRFISVGIRFHPDSYNDEGSSTYYEMNYRNYATNLIVNYNKETASGPLDNSGVDKIRNADALVTCTVYTLIYGFQFIAGNKIRTTHDLYMGLGFRKISYDLFETRSETYIDPNTGKSKQIYVATKQDERAAGYGLSFIAGYVFGFGF